MTQDSRQLLREQRAQQARQTRLRRIIAVVVAVVAAAVVAVVAVILVNSNRDAETPAGTGTEEPQTVTSGEPLTLGTKDAPVTMRLYEDPLCSHCLDLEKQVGSLVEEKVRDGQVRLQLFPMSFIAKESSVAVNGMACAAEGGFLGAMHHEIMMNPKSWTDADLTEAAIKVAPDKEKAFTECVSSQRHVPWITSINDRAKKDGVSGTPAVFLNDREIGPEQRTTVEAFRKLIDEAAGK